MTEKEFSKGVAVVAGGSGAIGGAVCLALARAGSAVALTYRSNRTAAENLKDKILSMGGSADICQVAIEEPASVANFIDRALHRHGSIHSVVYASGPQIPLKYINSLSPQEWADVMNVDVNGCFNLINAALPHLKAQGGGSVVAVTTTAVERVPQRDILSAAPKAAIEVLIRGLAKEEGRYGIRANSVAPGLLEEGLGREFIDHGLTPDLVDKFRRSVPVKRFGFAEEIADAVIFLLSAKARYITGQTLAVDGGMQL
ncbi:SDR family oxidoreductase [Microvirga makkahensis]|uniref:SDR family oxidoreductase n=1 Tax=Microvirga makkahensis TaxID=1128670 RepID=UPI00197B49BF